MRPLGPVLRGYVSDPAKKPLEHHVGWNDANLSTHRVPDNCSWRRGRVIRAAADHDLVAPQSPNSSYGTFK